MGTDSLLPLVDVRGTAVDAFSCAIDYLHNHFHVLLVLHHCFWCG